MRISNKKVPDFEINLMPVISILAVVISILLITTVWVRVGTFDLNQAFGTESKDNKKNPTSLWVQFDNDGSLKLVIKESMESNKFKTTVIRKKSLSEKMEAVRKYAQQIKRGMPTLNVALILPAPDSAYQDVIAVMDVLKKEQIADIGIAPL